MGNCIPLHSLVFCAIEQRFNGFAAHERLSCQAIESDLVGEARFELSAIIFEELKHRLRLKLSLGERVVVYTDDLSKEEQFELCAIASSQGATVVTEPLPVPAVTRVSSRQIEKNWQGITVIGDVHGELKAVSEALAWAKARGHFAWLLGDIIDYGSDTLKTMSTVYRAVMDGHAAMVVGNHERKIAKWLDQREHGGRSHLRMSDGNKVTTAALNMLKPEDQRQWIGQFRSLLAHSSLMFQFGNTVLVHAAVHPSFWANKPNENEIERFALYGEADQIGGKYHRTHRWMDQVPKDQMVFMGHDILHSFPIVKTGKKGGQIFCLDTGSGNGGSLSSADLKFDDGKLRLECFNRY